MADDSLKQPTVQGHVFVCWYTQPVMRFFSFFFHLNTKSRHPLRDPNSLNALQVKENLKITAVSFKVSARERRFWCNPLRDPSWYLLAHSRRSWVTFASLCATSPLPANSPSVSWRPRTWRKWMWEDCQVRTHGGHLQIHKKQDKAASNLSASFFFIYACEHGLLLGLWCRWLSVVCFTTQQFVLFLTNAVTPLRWQPS